MPDDIPITFTHRGKTYSGHFSPVSGAGSTTMWHLYSDETIYLGCLTVNQSLDFTFSDSDPKNEFKYKAREFGNWVMGQR